MQANHKNSAMKWKYSQVESLGLTEALLSSHAVQYIPRRRISEDVLGCLVVD